MSLTIRSNASAIARTLSPTGLPRSIAPRAFGPTAILRMYMSGKRLERARLADRDHRHGARAAARDHAAAFERIEREVDLDASRAELLPGRELVALAARPDDDLAVDREQLEGETHRGRRVVLGRLLVVPPEPARPRKRRPLGHARVALAEAEAVLLLLTQRIGPLGRRGLGHGTADIGCAAVSTSSITSPIASSMSPFSTTGTPYLRALLRMCSWISRMSPNESRYFS